MTPRRFFLLALGLLGWILLIPCAQAEGGPAAPQAAPPGAVVHYHGAELFRLQAGLGAFTAEDRARAVEARIANLEENPFSPLPPLRIVAEGNESEVVAGDLPLFTVTEGDAQAAGVPRAILAQARLDSVQNALVQNRPLNRLKALARGLLLALLVTLGAWLVYRLVHKGFRLLRERLEPHAMTWISRFRLQDLELVSEARARRLLNFLGRSVEVLVLLSVGYIYLSLLFSLFPWTRGLARRLLLIVLGPLLTAGRAVLDYLPNLFFLAIVLIGARYFMRLLHLVFGAIQEGKLRISGFHAEWADPTLKLCRILVLAFTLVLAFPYLPGSNSEAFKGVSLFVGVIFSLGSSGAMGNLIAGILITYMRPFRIGDRVQIGDTVGDVIERTALVTRLRTIKNVEVSVPNATVLSSQIHNFTACTQDRGLILHSTVTIGYDAPWRTVHALLVEAARATQGILADPEPFVFQTSLDDFYVSYQINAFTRESSRMADIQSNLHQNIQEAFNRGGVEIMSPHYQALREGNTTTIPPEHLPKDYKSQAVRRHQKLTPWRHEI